MLECDLKKYIPLGVSCYKNARNASLRVDDSPYSVLCCREAAWCMERAQADM